MTAHTSFSYKVRHPYGTRGEKSDRLALVSRLALRVCRTYLARIVHSWQWLERLMMYDNAAVNKQKEPATLARQYGQLVEAIASDMYLWYNRVRVVSQVVPKAGRRVNVEDAWVGRPGRTAPKGSAPHQLGRVRPDGGCRPWCRRRLQHERKTLPWPRAAGRLCCRALRRRLRVDRQGLRDLRSRT